MLLGDISSERGVSTPRGLVHRKVYSESVKTCNSWLFLSLLESFSPSLCSFFILPWTWVTPSVVWNAWRVHEGVKVVEEKECIHVHHCTLSIFHNCRNTFYSYSKPLEGMRNVADSRNEGQQVSWNTHMSFKSMNGVIPDESHGYSELALPCPALFFFPLPSGLNLNWTWDSFTQVY